MWPSRPLQPCRLEDVFDLKIELSDLDYTHKNNFWISFCHYFTIVPRPQEDKLLPWPCGATRPNKF